MTARFSFTAGGSLSGSLVGSLGAAMLAACAAVPPAQAQDGFRWVAEPRFEDAGAAFGGVVPLREGERWGLMGADGAWAAQPMFEAVGRSGGERIAVRLAGKWGVADTAGRLVVPPLYDEIGNVFGIPPGEGPCFLVGSHSDTQPEGGWLDGVYGVVAGLEIARASLEAGGPRIACVSFQDEEGRFTPLTGSRVWTGRLALEAADALADGAGVTLAEARRDRGALPPASAVSPDRFSGFLEIHIEQGPVLDIAGERIGVVESIVGIRSQRMSSVGEQNHDGTAPMAMRRDAFQALVPFTAAIERRFAGMVGPATVWTIGQVALHPNATSIVPGRADFWLQWRDGDDALLDRMREVIDATAEEVARRRGLSWSTSDYSQIAATRSDPALVEALAGAAERLAPGAWRRMPSGALHDAANASTHMPMAMLFVPSIGGRSHCFDEDTRREDLVLGAEVLAAAIGTFLAERDEAK